MEIEWRCLLNAIETVFTVQNLEKAPRIEPQSWRPMKEMDYDKELTKEEYCKYTSGMRRLAERVHKRRIEVINVFNEVSIIAWIQKWFAKCFLCIQFKPMFQDFDIPQAGLVSVDQVRVIIF